MLFKLLQNLEKEMKILNSFYEITTTLVPKSNKDKTDWLISLMTIDKNS